jgi:hypothetical protein
LLLHPVMAAATAPSYPQFTGQPLRPDAQPDPLRRDRWMREVRQSPLNAQAAFTPLAANEVCGSTWDIALRFDHLYDVAFGNGRLVATGANGAIQTSSDHGITWVHHDTDPTVWLERLVWNGSLFVAVGGSTILTSPDGVTWTRRDTSGAGDPTLHDVFWTGTQLMAVGTAYSDAENSVGVVLYSADGVTWTRRDISASSSIETIAWSGQLFVATGYDSARAALVFTSADGVTWTRRSLSHNLEIYDTTWGNGLFVAVGYSSDNDQLSILTSVNGVTWTPRESGGTVYGVTWSHNQFVATGYDRILTSPDGITWTHVNVNVHNTLSSIVWTGQQWVAVGVGGTLLTSANRTDWTRRDPAIVKGGLQGITSNGQQFVAVGYNGTLVTSRTGLSWTPRDTGNLNGLFDVAWNGRLFVVVGYGQNVLTSADGVTWTPRSLGDHDYYLEGVAWSGSQFAAVGYEYVNGSDSPVGVVVTSPDGITWTRRAVNVTADLKGIAWGGSQFAVVGYGGDYPAYTSVLMTSANAVAWETISSTVISELYDVAWGNSQFVAVGYSQTNGIYVILTSPNGIDWTAAPANGSMNGIIWNGEQFVAVGYSGTILTSPDGIAWTRQSTGVNAYLADVAWGNRQLIAVGDIILLSDCGSTDPATILITHYYTSIMRREPDAAGLAYWQDLIAAKQAQGLDVKPVFRDMANFFFNSAEYLARNTTDNEFITNLYLTFFQREPDSGGMNFWLDRLATGVSRNEVMSGFLYSPEFTAFMEDLGF